MDITFLRVPAAGQAFRVCSALALVPEVAPRGPGFTRGAWPFIGQLLNLTICPFCVRACVRACVRVACVCCVYCVCVYACTHVCVCICVPEERFWVCLYLNNFSPVHSSPPSLGGSEDAVDSTQLRMQTRRRRELFVCGRKTRLLPSCLALSPPAMSRHSPISSATIMELNREAMWHHTR